MIVNADYARISMEAIMTYFTAFARRYSRNFSCDSQ